MADLYLNRVPANFESLSHPEKIKAIVPSRLDRARYYGSVAVGMFKASTLDVVYGLRHVLAGKPLSDEHHQKYLNEGNAKLFDMAVKHGAIELRPESLLADDWQSEVDG